MMTWLGLGLFDLVVVAIALGFLLAYQPAPGGYQPKHCLKPGPPKGTSGLQ
jgi:hypothetical protein